MFFARNPHQDGNLLDADELPLTFRHVNQHRHVELAGRTDYGTETGKFGHIEVADANLMRFCVLSGCGKTRSETCYA